MVSRAVSPTHLSLGYMTKKPTLNQHGKTGNCKAASKSPGNTIE